MTETVGDNRRGSPPRVLLLYYSYTGQSSKVLEAAGEVFGSRGWQVSRAEIEFTDPRYSDRFSRFPMRHVWRDMLSVLPAQTRRVRGEFRVPPEAVSAGYDLVCIGSPTWWSTASMPIRSFLASDGATKLFNGTPFAVFVVCRNSWRGNLKTVRKLAQKQGGRYVGEVHFTYPGNEVSSMLALTSYLGSGEYRKKYLGVSLPPTNVQPDHLQQTREFATTIAAELFPTEPV